MDFRAIDDGLSVSPQILPADIPALAQHGFRAIICTRPDGEAPDQPSFAEIREAAITAGLECRYLPVTMDKLDDADVSGFTEALHSLQGPVLGYCRSGTRAALLWSLSQISQGADVAAVVKTTNGAGYNLSEALRKYTGR